MTSELKPCPFCDSNDIDRRCQWSHWDGYQYTAWHGYARCESCGAEGPLESSYDCPGWNDRYERTCTPIQRSKHEFDCSCCGEQVGSIIYDEWDKYEIERRFDNYCANCGAKVVTK